MSTATTNGKPETNDPAVLPLSPSETGSDGGSKGHGANGRFTAGNKCSKGNPFARRMAALRSAALEELTADDIRALMRRLHAQALVGDVASAALLLRYTLGRPPEGVDPDMLDLDEWRKLAAMPAYSEVAHVSMDGVVPALAIESISKLKAVEEPFRKEYVGVGQEILAEREAHRRQRTR
jgi:hypothetical protein